MCKHIITGIYWKGVRITYGEMYYMHNIHSANVCILMMYTRCSGITIFLFTCKYTHLIGKMQIKAHNYYDGVTSVPKFMLYTVYGVSIIQERCTSAILRYTVNVRTHMTNVLTSRTCINSRR